MRLLLLLAMIPLASGCNVMRPELTCPEPHTIITCAAHQREVLAQNPNGWHRVMVPTPEHKHMVCGNGEVAW